MGEGLCNRNDKSGRNTIEKEMISYIQQNFMEKISLKEFGEQFHLSENIYRDILRNIFILHFRNI